MAVLRAAPAVAAGGGPITIGGPGHPTEFVLTFSKVPATSLASINFFRRSGRSMRDVAVLLLLLTTQGCVSTSEQRSKQLLAKVAAEDVKNGQNPHLKIGMPLREAKAHLEQCGFQLEQRPRTGSTLLNPEASALHYVKIFPHPGVLVVFHHEVHVLLFHDEHRLTDIKSEAIYTSVD
jgi:hypothetical protein